MCEGGSAVGGLAGVRASVGQAGRCCCAQRPRGGFSKVGARGGRGARRVGRCQVESSLSRAKRHSWRDLSARPKAAQPEAAQVTQLAQATARTEPRLVGRSGRVPCRRLGWGAVRGGGQKAQGGSVAMLAGASGQAVMADFGQAFGQDVLEESFQEVFDG